VLNRVFLTKDDIIQIDVVGPQTAESVREMGEKIAAYVHDLQQAKKPILILDNLKAMGDTTPEARQEVARIARTINFDRGAMVGDANPLMRYGTNLMLRAINKSNLRYFASFDAALIWLQPHQAKVK
jgi:hypothetical protein